MNSGEQTRGKHAPPEAVDDAGWDWSSTVVVLLGVTALLMITLSMWVRH